MITAALLQAALEIMGLVAGPDHRPVAGALVIAGDLRTTTDGQGRFRLLVPDGGARELRISAPGLEPQTRQGLPGAPITVLMEKEAASATVVVSEGSSYTSQEGSASTLSRIDIYTTPGAAADVFQAAKSLPGVSNASEGAELFVRGGKPEEVGIYLNGGHLTRPFHHPNTQGGIFSSVDTALVTKLDFIPGGFSARYGDALSAVLDISTEVDTPSRTTSLLLTVPTQGLAADRPMGDGLLRTSLRHSDPILLDKWYGLAPTFDESPISNDGQVNFQAPLGQGRLSATVLISQDHLAVETTIANARDLYRNRSQSAYGALELTQAMGERTSLLFAVSHSRFNQTWSFNHWGIRQEEHGTFLRMEGCFQLAEGQNLQGGLDRDSTALSPQGQVPYDLSNWNPEAPARTFTYGFEGTRQGAYLTWKSLLSPRWGLSVGGRTDHYSLAHESTRDLRATLSFLLREGLTLRVAGGSFHQIPLLTQLDPHAGNPGLRVLRATHALAALDAAWKAGPGNWNLRLEAYRKDYDHLVEEDPLLRYASTGRGYAQGLDLLIKGQTSNWRGWIGYGYLDTARREGKQHVEGPVPTSVPHNVTVVSTHTLTPGWELGASFRYASGAPVTPILGGLPDPKGGFDPILGPAYSDFLPAYGRGDLRLTHFFPWGKVRCVVFGEVMNLLNRHNVAAYTYPPDYGHRGVNESYFSRRILVVGASLGW